MPVPFDCLPEVLDTEQPIAIGGRAGLVATPKLPPNVKDPDAWMKLQRPTNADPRLPLDWEGNARVSREHDWARPIQLPSLLSVVNAIQLWFPLDSHEQGVEAAHEVAEAIRAEIPAWTERMTAAIELLTRQNLDSATFAELAAHRGGANANVDPRSQLPDS